MRALENAKPYLSSLVGFHFKFMVLLNWYFDLILSHKKPTNAVNNIYGPESRYHKCHFKVEVNGNCLIGIIFIVPM